MGSRRLGPWALLLLPAMLLDQHGFPAPRDSRSFSVSVNDGVGQVAAVLPEGAVLTLPKLTPDPERCALDTAHLFDAMHHGRPVSAGFGDPADGLSKTTLLTRSLLEAPQRAIQLARRDEMEACVAADLSELHELGVGGILLLDGWPDSSRVFAAATALLGEPDHSAPGAWGWDVPSGRVERPGGCPPVTRRGASKPEDVKAP